MQFNFILNRTLSKPVEIFSVNISRSWSSIFVQLVRRQNPETSSLSRTTGLTTLLFRWRSRAQQTIPSLLRVWEQTVVVILYSIRRSVRARGNVSSVTARLLVSSTFVDSIEIVYRWALFHDFFLRFTEILYTAISFAAEERECKVESWSEMLFNEN